MTQQQDIAIARKTLAIMAKAGNPLTQCPTCTRRADAPYRNILKDGTLVAGCIDAFHTESLAGLTTGSAHWHFRKTAQEWRRAHLKHLASL